MAWSAQEQDNIKNFYNKHKGDVGTIKRGMGELNITADQMAQYTGQSLDSFNNYLNGGTGNGTASSPYANKPSTETSSGNQNSSANTSVNSSTRNPYQAPPTTPPAADWGAQEQQNIKNFYNSNKGDVGTIKRGMGELKISADQMARYTGQSLDQFNNYLNGSTAPQAAGWSNLEQQNIKNFWTNNQNDAASIIRGMGELNVSASDLAKYTGQTDAQMAAWLKANGAKDGFAGSNFNSPTPQPKPSGTAPAQDWSAQEQDNIRNFYNKYKGDVGTIKRGMGELNISADQMARYTGQSLDQFNAYLNGSQGTSSQGNSSQGNSSQGNRSQTQGGSVADQQARINAWAASNGMQAPNLSDPAFAYLMTGGSDATANWIRQNIGARTMQGGGGNSYTTGVTPTNPKGNTNVDPTDRNMSVTPNITQGQANTNNYWANAANSYLGGNNDWANNAPGFTPTQSYSPNGLNTMSMEQARTPVPPQGPGNGYNPRDARYQANPQSSGGGGNLGLGGGQAAIGSGTINPWGYDLGNTLVRQSGQDFNDNIMPALRSSAQAAGQYGGSRQGMAGGIAAGRSMDALTSGLAQLYGGLYNTDQSNTTTRIGQGLTYDLGRRTDLSNLQQLANQYDLGRRTDLTTQQQLANQYDLGRRSDAYQLGQLGLNANTAQQNFYNSQRELDLRQYQLGANMFQGGVTGNLGIGAGMTQLGSAAQNAPLWAQQQYQAMIQPFSGINSTPTTYTGGPNAGAAALGGALGYAQLGRNLYNQYGNNGNNGNTTTGQAGANLVSQGQEQGWM